MKFRKRLPKSLRKFLRKEKARLRKTIFDPQQAEEEIKKMVKKIYENFSQ